MAVPAWAKRIIIGAGGELSPDEDGIYTEEETLPFASLRRLQVRYGRDPGGLPTDPAITTHDFVNFTGAVPDDTWETADFAAVETAFDAFWAALNPVHHAIYTLDQYRWYHLDADTVPPNPAVRIVERNVRGGALGTPLPPQVAISVTERTSIRRRWGRFYLPPPGSTILDGTGQLAPTSVDKVADAAEALYAACFAADIVPVVWSPTKKRAYGVESIQVDSLLDVIRSRRWKTPSLRDRRPPS